MFFIFVYAEDCHSFQWHETICTRYKGQNKLGVEIFQYYIMSKKIIRLNSMNSSVNSFTKGTKIIYMVK